MRESTPPHNPSLGDALAPPYSSIYLSGLHGRGPRHSNGIELSPFSHTPPSVPTYPHRFPSARPSRPHTPAGVPSCIPPPPGAWHFYRRLPPPPRHLGTGQKARVRDEALILRHRALTRRQHASIGTRPRSRRRTAPARGSTGPSRHPVAPAAPRPAPRFWSTEGRHRESSDANNTDDIQNYLARRTLRAKEKQALERRASLAPGSAPLACSGCSNMSR